MHDDGTFSRIDGDDGWCAVRQALARRTDGIRIRFELEAGLRRGDPELV